MAVTCECWGCGRSCVIRGKELPEQLLQQSLIAANDLYHIIKSLRLEKTSKIIESNLWPITSLSIGPWHWESCPVYWALSGKVTPPPCWAAPAWSPFLWRNSSWWHPWQTRVMEIKRNRLVFSGSVELYCCFSHKLSLDLLHYSSGVDAGIWSALLTTLVL